jgi:nucleoside phosphorylase
MPARTLSREAYTVDIICALEFEKAVVQATLDEQHDQVEKTPGDDNTYAFGNIDEHNVVVAWPTDGRASAVTAARDMMRSFPIKVGLMVGIGDGARSEHTDIRLGDLVVGNADDGLVQWDYGKTADSGRFWTTGTLKRPPQPLLQMLQILGRLYTPNDGGVGMILEATLAKHPLLREEFGHQGLQHDELFEASYEHAGGETCADCDRSCLVRHRPHRTNLGPRVYYGKIGSGNEVLERGPMIDKIAREEGMICFETEAAGLPDTFPCVVIRGVCGYADSHKTARWQKYAAMVAAAYAKHLLLCVPAADLAALPLANEATGRHRCISSRMARSWLTHVAEPPIPEQVVCLPLPSSGQFVGRRAELEILERRIVTAPDCKRLVVFGADGVGKSRLVLKFAYWVAENHPDISVFWISAANTADIVRAIETIVHRLGIRLDQDRSAASRDLLKRHLSAPSAGKWLLIVDEVDDVEHSEPSAGKNTFMQNLPESPLGATIFTTRSARVAQRLAGRDSLQLMEMTSAEATELLKTVADANDRLKDSNPFKEFHSRVKASETTAVDIDYFNPIAQLRPRLLNPVPYAGPDPPFTLQNILGGIHSPRTSSAPGGLAPSTPSADAKKLTGLQRIKPCYIMVALGLLAIGGSLAVGLFYSIAQDRMGDGFTTAGWMVAVSTLMLAAPMAKHYPKCRCWESHEYAVL